MLHSEGLSIESLNQDIVEEVDQLKAIHNIRTPGAVQLATSVKGSASFILTNESSRSFWDTGIGSEPVVMGHYFQAFSSPRIRVFPMLQSGLSPHC